MIVFLLFVSTYVYHRDDVFEIAAFPTISDCVLANVDDASLTWHKLI